MSSRLALLTLALAALLGSWPGAARAQAEDDEAAPQLSAEEQEAREAFVGARAQFDAGNYAAALPAFERAYALSGRAELIYNIALCHDRLGHEQDALDQYQRFLDEVPDTERRRSIEVRIRVLRESLDRTAALAAAAAAREPEGEDLAQSPILWTLVGVAVVGAALGIGLGVGLSQDPGMQMPSAGPSGVLVYALTF